MGKKCKVWNCFVGQPKCEEKYSVFGFPKDNLEEFKLWLRALPNKNLKPEDITKNNGVCAKHWKDWEKGTVPSKKVQNGSLVPTIPPNFWGPYPGDKKSKAIPPSILRSPPPKPRGTKKSSSAVRSAIPDEMAEFESKMKMNYSNFHAILEQYVSEKETFSYIAKHKNDSRFFSILSGSRLEHASAVYSHAIHCEIKFAKNQSVELLFEAFAGLKRVHYKGGKIARWDEFEELLRLVTATPEEEDKKFDFVVQQVKVLNKQKNTKLYDREDLLQAFNWYMVSSSLYKKLRSVIKIPSITTLKNITRLAKNKSDEEVFTSFFAQQEERSRNCIFIIDEIYVKASVTYRGKSVVVVCMCVCVGVYLSACPCVCASICLYVCVSV